MVGKLSRVINIVAGSAELSINIPELDGRFWYNVFNVAGSYLPCSLVFYVDEVSVMLNADNPVFRSPF